MIGGEVSSGAGLHLRTGQERLVPPEPEPPSPKPRPGDLIALMHFVVDELQQEPHDIAQDKGGDQIPVNHVPQTADTPVGGPGQGSGRIRERAETGSAWGQESAGTGAPTPRPGKRLSLG